MRAAPRGNCSSRARWGSRRGSTSSDAPLGGERSRSLSLSGAARVRPDGRASALVSIAGGGSFRHAGSRRATRADAHCARGWGSAEAGCRSTSMTAARATRCESIRSSRTSAQGFSVALSADGNTALIGGPDDGTAGAAWVFTRANSTWTQQGAKLVSSGASGSAEQGFRCSASCSRGSARGRSRIAWPLRPGPGRIDPRQRSARESPEASAAR